MWKAVITIPRCMNAVFHWVCSVSLGLQCSGACQDSQHHGVSCGSTPNPLCVGCTWICKYSTLFAFRLEIHWQSIELYIFQYALFGGALCFIGALFCFQDTENYYCKHTFPVILSLSYFPCCSLFVGGPQPLLELCCWNVELDKSFPCEVKYDRQLPLWV